MNDTVIVDRQIGVIWNALMQFQSMRKCRKETNNIAHLIRTLFEKCPLYVNIFCSEDIGYAR